MNIEQVNIDKIIFAEYNPRRLTEDQAKSLRDSLERFGFVDPVIINNHPSRNNILIGGHQRVRIWKAMGNKDVPAIYISLDKDKERELNVRLNKNVGEWSWEDLANNFSQEELIDWGFTEEELLGNIEVKIDETEGNDEVPESAPAITKLGDLYELGEHRLLCGDSTDEKEVTDLLIGEEAVLFNTDPPYGVSLHDVRDTKKIENDDLTNEKLQEFLEAVIKTALPFMAPNAAYYLWHPMLTQGAFFAAAAAAAADILIHRQIIWVKPSLIMGHGDYHWKHELCFYGWVKGNRPNWYAGRDQHTIWEVGRENDHIHPTQKPVELFIRPIMNHTKPSEVVYEPFSGSGSQLIAAEITNRRCYGMEIDPHYCDVIVKRYADFCQKNDRPWSVKRNNKDISEEYFNNSGETDPKNKSTKEPKTVSAG